MNERLTWTRLVLKELKQLRPLLLTLVGCSLGFHLFFILINRDLPHEAIPWTICCLYNAGVGAILVGQEKEKGTLTWLRTLPITPTKLLASKFLAGILGFFLLALCVNAVCRFAVFTDPPNSKIGSLPDLTDAPAVAITSFAFVCLFLFSVGFALAWKLDSALLSITLILPSTLVPLWLSSIVFYHLQRRNPALWLELEPIFGCITFAIAALIASVLAWRFGMTFLRPSRASQIREAPVFATQMVYKPPVSPSSLAPPTSPALLWQFLKQNRWLLTSLTLVATLPFVVGASVSDHEQTMIGVGFLCGGFVTTWLGVLTFASDASKNRIRFLASIGVSPSKVWWTRQLAPLIIVLLGGVLTSTLIATAFSTPHSDKSNTFPELIFSVFFIYSIAQWTGQVIRSTIIAMVFVPVVVMGFLSANFAAVQYLGAPLWLRWMELLIPFIATWIGMKAWMDGRTGLRYWLLQGSLLLLPFALGFYPVVRVYFDNPPISQSASNELKHLAKEYPYNGLAQKRIVFPGRIDSFDGRRSYSDLPYSDIEKPTANQTIPSRREQIESVIDGFEKQLSETDGPIELAYGCSGFLQSCAAVARMRLEDDSDSDRDALIARYRRSIKLLLQMQVGLRKNARLLEQDAADRLEAWLLREAERDDASRILGKSLLNELGAVFRDTERRTQYRRWAVAKSREQSTVDSNRLKFGGMEVSIPVIQGTYTSKLAADHRVDMICKTLLDCLNAGDEGQRREMLESVARLYGYQAAPTDNAPYIVLTSLSSPYPGYLWFGDWEAGAAHFPSQDDQKAP